MSIGKCVHGWVLFIFLLVASAVTRAQVLPPSTYYSTITNLTGSALESSLHGIIFVHTDYTYDGAHTALTILDADAANSNNVIEIYSGYSVAASTWPSWNREHIYPESYGTSAGTQHNDLFNLRACDQGVNSSRNNKYYDISGVPPPVSHPVEAPDSSYDNNSWEPRDADKGFVARACFYISTCYDGSGGSTNLQLADSPNAGAHIFAKLSTLLDWNRRFPPTDWERGRNGLIYQTYQHNRNPFIDNPDFADMVFLDLDGFSAWENDHFSAAELSNSIITATTAASLGDGVPNLVKYVLGHDPHVVDGSTILSVTPQTVGGTNFLYFTHHRNHYLSGVTLTYQTSTTLTTWFDTAVEQLSSTQIDYQKDLVTARVPASTSPFFLRLKTHRLADVAAGADFLTVSPLENFVSAGTTNGPFSPVSQAYTLSNTGGTDLTWTASESVNWLTLSATAGTLSAGSSTVVTVSINANANSLTVGAYSDTISFANTTSGNGNTARLVTLTIVNPAPVIETNATSLASESCNPGNGFVDPGETVTVNFGLDNIGNKDTSNLVVTLQAMGGVTSPSGPQTYGAVPADGSLVTQPFTFTASGSCGGTITAALQLQDGPDNLGTITYSFPLGITSTTLTQEFDGVAAPSLPSGWTSSASGAQSNWVTSTAAANTSPNSAFSSDPGTNSINELDAPTMAINSASAQLTFVHSYNLPASATNSSLGYDGGVLEIAIGGGSYTDIVAAGGSFVSGAYNTTISSSFSNPLAGRQAWSGNSGGFITTTVNLPPAAASQNVQLRWRCGSGNPPLASSGTLAFWNFDNSNSFATANLTAPAVSALPVSTTNTTGSISTVQGNPSSGQAISSTGWTTNSGPPSTSYSCYTFAVTVTNGYQASLTTISFDDRASATGPTNFSVQVSQQANFASLIYDSGIKISHVSSSVTFVNESLALTNSGLTGTIYFRIYGYKATGGSGTWRIDNLNIQGAVTPTGPTPGGSWYIDSISVNDASCCQ